MNSPGGFLSDLRTVLRGGDFRKLFVTRLTSQFADGAFQVGLAGVFFFSPERAATAEAVAGAFAVSVLPYTVVGPFAGVLLDRWRRRQLLFAVNLLRSVLVLLVAGLVAAHVVGPALFVIILICLSMNRFFLAGLGAALPHVVEAEELVMANAVSPTSGTVLAIIGGGVGYGVRVLLGAGDRTDAVVVLLAAVGYLLAALLVTRIEPDQLGPDQPNQLEPDDVTAAPWSDIRSAAVGVLTGLRTAVAHLNERRPAARALAAVGGHRFAYGTTTLATVLLCRNHFADPRNVNAGLGLLAAVFAVSGAGFALAAFITPIATHHMRRTTWVVLCYAAAALVTAILAANLTRYSGLVAAFILAVAAQGSKICIDAILQSGVDDAYRGRVMSFYDVVFNVAFVSAAAVTATVLPADGYSVPVFLAIALIYAVTAFFYWRSSRRPQQPHSQPTGR